GHPDHHRVFAAAQELGLPFGIHPTFEPKWAAPGRFADMTSIRFTFFINVTAPDAVRHAFTSLFQFGVFDLFPQLRVVVLESGASWIGYWLDRMDAVYVMPQGKTVPLKEKPSVYFRRQCWISADPDETTLAAIIPLIGEDRFFWASDFPHPDHAPEYVGHMSRMVAALTPRARDGILGANVLRAYGLT
ncbi:MAG TPA: amidohydrolase family protein, partial [Candidatus Acidoferrales bacterium]|nr:amidohydrolase family protein [Candidatus Acidoferrales bacterium]